MSSPGEGTPPLGSSASRPWVAAAEALGWATLAAAAWGGIQFQAGGRAIALVDVGLLSAPWLVLLAAGVSSGKLTRLEDVPLLRRLHALVRAAAARPALALSALAAVYCAVLAGYAFRAYDVHASGAYDLGIFDQVVWGTLHGAPLRSSTKGDISILGDHFEPILALISPIYLLWDDPRCLLLFQTLAIASGVVPAYLLARRRFGPGALALAFAGAYLAYGSTRQLNAYHFHPVALVLPIFLFAALWLEEGRTGPFLLALALAAACQENIPLAIAGWGAALALFRPRRPALGAALASAGLALFLFEIMVVIPRYAGAARFGYLARYADLGGSVGEILRTIATHPWIIAVKLVTPSPKLEYLLRVFGPFALLPLLRGGWRWLLPVAPVLLQNTLTSYPKMYSTAFQYTAPMTPFILLGAMDGARGLLERAGTVEGVRRWVSRRSVALAMAVGLLAAGGESQVFQARMLRWDDRFARIAPVLAALPREAAVSAQAGIFTHVAHRHHAYVFPEYLDRSDYVVLDRDGYFQPSRAEYERAVASLPARGFAPVIEQDGFLVFERRPAAPPASSPAAGR